MCMCVHTHKYTGTLCTNVWFCGAAVFSWFQAFAHSGTEHTSHYGWLLLGCALDSTSPGQFSA